MSEPPIVNPSRTLPEVSPVRESFPDLADYWEQTFGVKGTDKPKRRTIFATRTDARELIAARPDVSATGAVYIDLRETRAAAPPFVDELLRAWPLAQPIGANEDVQASWDLVVERLSPPGAGDR